MALTTVADDVYRDYALDGVPSSGPHNPRKPDIRRLLGGYEQVIKAFTSAGGLIFDTLALLNGDLAKAANSMAWVIGDSTVANNGVYKKVGPSGAGSWARVADLPYSFIVASDVGAGTANAIVATTPIPVSQSALIILNIFETNTASPVTVSFNGGTPLTIRTVSGNDVSPGGLLSGMRLGGFISGSSFRLITDQSTAADVAAAQQAASEAMSAAGEATGRALVYPATGPQIYNAENRKIGNVADATEEQDAVNRRTLLALALTTAGGVWVGEGLRMTALADGEGLQDAVTRNQLLRVFKTQRSIPHPNFNFLADYGEVFDCPGPGRARHNIEISTAWQRIYKTSTGTSGRNFPQSSPNLAADKFVDWVNGSDSNSGSINAPYKTVAKALTTSLHTIWMLPGDSKEVLALNYADTVNANGRPLRIRALYPGTVRFIGRSDKCEEMMWTLGAAQVYTATPSVSANVYSITWNPSPGVYIPVPYNPAKDTGFYWDQNTTTKQITIRAFGKDFTQQAVKSQFLIAYLPAANNELRGVNVLIEDIDFVGTGQLSSRFDTGLTRRPVLFLNRCRFILTPNGNAVHSAGGLLVAQDCEIYGSGFDGFNYYEGENASLTPCTFLEIDCKASFAGWMHGTPGIPVNRNNQSSSGHQNAIGIRINCDYGEGNYGQSIADTGAGAYYWMIGTVCRDPYFDYYGATLNNFTSMYVEGSVWLDTVAAGGRGSMYGLQAVNANVSQFNSQFTGETQDVVTTSASVSDYVPFTL